MSIQYYIPDRTLQNALIILRTKKSNTVILSCKKCPNGVSPTGTEFHSFANVLWPILSFIFVSISHFCVDAIAQEEWSQVSRIIMTIILTIACFVPTVTLVIFLSLHFTKWIPAEPRTNQTKQTYERWPADIDIGD